MIKLNRKKDCSGCHACSNVCPIKCIEMVEDKEGFLYPQVDNTKCINCSMCEKVCPIINKKERINKTEAYACINNNEEIRLESSSGGVFTLLAERVINNGGMVFGAGFDDEFNLKHSYINSIEGISKYRGSKYLQSEIGETYKQAKESLEKGIEVLFTGTPCQISGLLSYLGREYDNLICVDIICHGVPSPKVFKKYRIELEEQYRTSTRKISFRSKNFGWKLYSMSLSFNNETEYTKDFTKDVFMKGFLNDLYLRPSCYDCKFKSLNRVSDMTIADFWGVENIDSEFDDQKGTSLVLINSEKGANIFGKIQDKMISKVVDVEKAIKYNPSAIRSVEYNPKRENFFGKLDSKSNDISKLIIKCTKVGLVKSNYVKIRTILSKVKRKLSIKR